MFCSSLRRRSDWAPILSRFSEVGSFRWREANLQSHDIAFPVTSTNAHGGTVTFKSILLGTDEISTPETKERIERLHLLNGGRYVAIILLLKGEDAMGAFVRLQIQMHGCADIPIIPISSATDLPPRIEQLRRKTQELGRQGRPHNKVLLIQLLLKQCVSGKDTRPLSQRQTNILMDITTGFQDLLAKSLDIEGQSKISDYLGGHDGSRVLSFLTNGPQRVIR